MAYGIQHMVHKHKDPTNPGVWNPPLSWALEPECRIFMYLLAITVVGSD